MRNPRNTLTLVVASIIGCAVGTLWTRPSAAQAQRSEARKWEYCAITQIYSRDNGQGGRETCAQISYLLPSAPKSEEYVTSTNANGEAELGESAFYKTTAKLGSDGWEMVGRVGWNSALEHAVFFKRPK